ncbi:MAG: hypothetical protein B6D41_00475 [Chloroflexi bacterium UTCFX4]|nr:MAG: hypothetical protein B6D41_00475 [Chloroflexi bacterium UTCFX4]
MKTKIVHLTMLFVLLALAAMIVPLAPAQAMSDVPCDATALINAIQNAVTAGGSQTLSLATNCTYTLTAANNGGGTPEANGLPIIANNVNLTIVGNSATIQRDANAPHFRMFSIDNGSTLVLSAVTLRGGRAADGKKNRFAGSGGAIHNRGTLQISLSNILENRAGDAGKSVNRGGDGGGIWSSGTLVIAESNIGKNSAGIGAAGAIQNVPEGWGGGIYSYGNTTITNSAIYKNTTGKGGYGGGHGGGIAHLTKKLVLANSTLSGNKAIRGLAGALFLVEGKTTIVNATIANNSGSGAGGIWNAVANVKLKNTIVANNDTVDYGDQCHGPLENVANNLDTGTSCGFGSANGSKSNADPNLEPLASNGAGTLNHAFKKPSDAYNKGDNAICNSAPVNGRDQRGVARPQASKCDIGSFELEVVTNTPTPTHTPTSAPTVTPTMTPSPTPTQPPSEVCAGPSNGRVSCWKGEDNANDSVGTNNGTLEGSVTFVSGKVGQAFNFDGTTADVRVPASSSLNVGSANGLTIAAWVNPTTLAQRSPLVEWSNNGTYGAHFWMSVTDVIPGGVNGNLYANLTSFAHGTQYVVQTTGAVLTANSWNHVVLTYDKTNGNVAMYVNGVASPVSSSNLGIVTPDTSFDMYLARRVAGQAPAARLSGKMDEVQIWDRALTAGEVQAIYSANASSACDTQQVLNSANSHYYQAVCVPDGITWQDAQNAAAARGGYLATITSRPQGMILCSGWLLRQNFGSLGRVSRRVHISGGFNLLTLVSPLAIGVG